MKTIGIGRFVRDPELKEVGNTHVCEFSLAVNEYRKINGERKKYTNFFDFVIWDKAAELIAKYKVKGDLIYVVATARQDKWVDKETGGNRSRVVFRVDDFTFIPRGGGGSYTENDVSEDEEDVEEVLEEDTEEVPF